MSRKESVEAGFLADKRMSEGGGAEGRRLAGQIAPEGVQPRGCGCWRLVIALIGVAQGGIGIAPGVDQRTPLGHGGFGQPAPADGSHLALVEKFGSDGEQHKPAQIGRLLVGGAREEGERPTQLLVELLQRSGFEPARRRLLADPRRQAEDQETADVMQQCKRCLWLTGWRGRRKELARQIRL